MAREVNSELLDKRDALHQKKLLDAIAESGRSYEENILTSIPLL